MKTILKRILGQTPREESDKKNLELEKELKESKRRREEAIRRLVAIEATLPARRKRGTDAA